jgi:hypothetical protein
MDNEADPVKRAIAKEFAELIETNVYRFEDDDVREAVEQALQDAPTRDFVRCYLEDLLPAWTEWEGEWKGEFQAAWRRDAPPPVWWGEVKPEQGRTQYDPAWTFHRVSGG